MSCSSAWLTQRRNQQCSPTAQEKFRLTTPSLLSRGTQIELSGVSWELGRVTCPRSENYPTQAKAAWVGPREVLVWATRRFISYQSAFVPELFKCLGISARPLLIIRNPTIHDTATMIARSE